MRKLITSLLTISFAFSYLYALEGSIVDKNGVGIGGISVQVKGTKYSTVSASDGSWSIATTSQVLSNSMDTHAGIQWINSNILLNLKKAGLVKAERLSMKGEFQNLLFSDEFSQGYHQVPLQEKPETPSIIRITTPDVVRVFLTPVSNSSFSKMDNSTIALGKSVTISDTLVIGYKGSVIGQVALDNLNQNEVADIVLATVVPTIFPKNSGSVAYEGLAYLLPGTNFTVSIDYDPTLWRPLWLHIGDADISISRNSIEASLTSVSDEVRVEMASRIQSFSFPSVSSVNYGEPAFEFDVTSNSKLAVELSSATPLICDFVSGKLKVLDVGKCIVLAEQDGSDQYNAKSETVSFAVVPRQLTVQPIHGHTKVFDGTISATVSRGIDYTLEGLVDGEDVDISVSNVSYNDKNVNNAEHISFEYSAILQGDHAYRYKIESGKAVLNASITKAIPEVLAWPTAGAIVYGQSLAASTLVGGNGDGTFSWYAATVKPLAGYPLHDVLFTPTDAENYSKLLMETAVQVDKAEQIISMEWWYLHFPTAYASSQTAYGNGVYSISESILSPYLNSQSAPNGDDIIAHSSSGLPLQFYAFPSYACTVDNSTHKVSFVTPFNTDYACKLVAVQPGDNNFKSASADLDFVIVGVYLLEESPTVPELIPTEDFVSIYAPESAIQGSTVSASVYSISGLPVTVNNLTPAKCNLSGSNGNYSVQMLGQVGDKCNLHISTPGSTGWTSIEGDISVSIVAPTPIHLSSYRIVKG